MLERIEEHGGFKDDEKVEALLTHLDLEPVDDILDDIVEDHNEYSFDGESYRIYTTEEAEEYAKDWNDELYDINVTHNDEIPDYIKSYIYELRYISDHWSDFEDIQENSELISTFNNTFYICQ